jgi:hypothetical protein
MAIKIYLTAQRFENYDYGKINIENPYWKPEGKKVFRIELDSDLLNGDLIYESKRNKVFSKIVNSYSDSYERYDYISYSFKYDVIKVSQQEILRYL